MTVKYLPPEGLTIIIPFPLFSVTPTSS